MYNDTGMSSVSTDKMNISASRQGDKNISSTLQIAVSLDHLDTFEKNKEAGTGRTFRQLVFLFCLADVFFFFEKHCILCLHLSVTHHDEE